MLITEILSEEKLEELRLIVKNEININYMRGPGVNENFPKWQSYADMHEKFNSIKSVNNLIEMVKLCFKKKYGIDGVITHMWFVLVNKDSEQAWHEHGDSYSCIFYLENTFNSGTVLIDKQVPAEDNSLFFIDPGVLHTPPKWSGIDRYVIAMDIDVLNNK